MHLSQGTGFKHWTT